MKRSLLCLSHIFFSAPVLLLSLTAFLLTGCATPYQQQDPLVGAWDYEMHNLPRGEPLGVMTIEKIEEGYSIKLVDSAGREYNLKEVSVEGNALTGGHFRAAGYTVVATGIFEEGSFEGQLHVRGYVFRMTATQRE